MTNSSHKRWLLQYCSSTTQYDVSSDLVIWRLVHNLGINWGALGLIHSWVNYSLWLVGVAGTSHFTILVSASGILPSISNFDWFTSFMTIGIVARKWSFIFLDSPLFPDDSPVLDTASRRNSLFNFPSEGSGDVHCLRAYQNLQRAWWRSHGIEKVGLAFAIPAWAR